MTQPPHGSRLSRDKWDKILRIAAVVAAVGLFIVILIGFLDTLTGSAEGCGRMWTLCNGGVLPGFTEQSQIEYWHRAITGMDGLLVGILAIWAWRRHWQRWDLVVPAVVGAGFVAVQSAVGALAVIYPESAPLLATHFGFALLAFAGFALLAIGLLQMRAPVSGFTLRSRTLPLRLRWGALGLLVYIMGAAYWGTYVAHVGGGTACTGWPLCNGQLVPTLTDSVLPIFFHRLVAVGAGVWGVWLYLRCRPLKGIRPDVYRAAHVILGLVVLLILSGAELALSRLAVGWDLVHVGFVTLLFTTASYLFLQTLPPFAEREPRARALRGA